ncbi:D-2-hydroxyglutarate dehydrogenase YdiJ [Gloeothece verrucosa]|nr:FAD-binding and (Fe-S)-binding domain-containing protein [Gloeothece verrucosa]
MIPRLKLHETLQPEYAEFLEQLRKTPFSGEIRADFGSRLITSTDNSIYQILPQAALFPKTGQDLVVMFHLAAQNPFKSITFSPRGGGTGTNGQALSPGIIIDCSKYMNQILELNLEQGWVRVQPGVILDQLNAYLKPLGLFFAASLAPSNRATLGGMINTDACGKGSRIYGRTSDHVLELSWVLVNGEMGQSQSIDLNTLTHLKQQPNTLGKIYRQIDEIVTQKRELIAQQFPKIPRFMTGYNLAKVYSPEQETFNLNRILAGSEGTLAIITEAKLKLTPIPKYKQLLAIHYHCFDDALLAASTLLQAEPAAIETLDEKIVELAKEDEIYYQVKDWIEGAKAINLVEFIGDAQTSLERKINQLIEQIETNRHQPQQASGYYLAKNNEEIQKLWELRKKGVGLLGNQKGNRKPIPFIEDTAVPPSQLMNYVQDLKKLLNEYQLDYGMFGHVDVGCLHIRPALDMKLPDDETLIRKLSDQVVALVRQYGGVMWGEHGKGFRSEYTPLFFGEELYQDLRKIKAAFDPENRLNPGKIVTPKGSDGEVVKIESSLRGHFDRQVPAVVRSQYEEVFNCNGNGACFNYNPHEVICPSAKETRDRIHSPKGRASLLREWLRQISLTQADKKPPNLGTLEVALLRVGNTLLKWWGVYDYSHEVYQGMSGCLGCKACVSQCPVHVNIPEFKARFLELYHTRYLRPWRDYLMGNIEMIASWQANSPQLFNLITHNALTYWVSQQLLGLVYLPQLSEFTLQQGLRERKAPLLDLKQLSQLTKPEKSNSVILLQDAFTSFYESQLVLDTYYFLDRLGYTVYIAPFFPNGKPLHVKGFLKQFQSRVKKNIEYLTQLNNLGIPLIGIEPSMVLAYRDEYHKYNDLSMNNLKINLLQEWLVTHLDQLPYIPTDNPYYLLSHCTEKTLALESSKQWQKIFKTMGIPLNLMQTGCCGMAGMYGHETEHYASSRGIYQSSWGPVLAAIEEKQERVLVSGYSCRSQVKRCEGWTPLHPVQGLLSQIKTQT